MGWRSHEASKSPFYKGGFRGIFNRLSQNPPQPPFTKGGEQITKLPHMGLGEPFFAKKVPPLLLFGSQPLSNAVKPVCLAPRMCEAHPCTEKSRNARDTSIAPILLGILMPCCGVSHKKSGSVTLANGMRRKMTLKPIAGLANIPG